jgi:glycosyltransferase involved in cell wall biosynthesis
MAAARPLIAGVKGEAADLIREAGAGLVVPPESPEHLVTAFRQLRASAPMRERLARAGRAYAERELGREASLDRWEAAIELAISRRSGRAPGL